MVKKKTDHIRWVVGLFCLVAVACSGPPSGMRMGEKGRLYFGASPTGALSTRLMVGSSIRFHTEKADKDSNDDVLLVNGQVRVDPADAAEIVSGNGATFLLKTKKAAPFSVVVEDAEGNEMDRFPLEAAKVHFVDLQEAQLGAFNIDGRFPDPAGLVWGDSIEVAFDIADRCGTPLLITDEVNVDSTDTQLVTFTRADGAVNGTVTPMGPGLSNLQVHLPDGSTHAFPVQILSPGDVTQVDFQLVEASASDQALFWARSFANGNEIMGTLATWTGGAALEFPNGSEGPAVEVSVLSLDAGEIPPEDLTLTVEAFGETAAADIRDLAPSGGTRLAARDIPTSSGCGDDGGCQSFAFILPFFLLPRRRLCDLLSFSRRNAPHG